MTRFLLLAIPLLLLAMGLFAFTADMLDLAPEPPPALGSVLRVEPVAGRFLAAGWLLESLALTGLFLLIQGRSGLWLLDGLMTGWIAWIFRGPVLVVTIAILTRLPRDPWWPLAVQWLVLYSACGLLLAAVARRVGLER